MNLSMREKEILLRVLEDEISEVKELIDSESDQKTKKELKEYLAELNELIKKN